MNPKPAAKPLIAVDIDEVIFPLVPSLIEYVDTTHKVSISFKDFASYKIEDIWPGGPEEGRIVYKQYRDQEHIEIAPIQGAKEALEHLAKNYELVVITARSTEVEQKTKQWIYRHFPKLFKDVHLLGYDHDGGTHRTKADMCLELGAEYLIDDHPENILLADKAGIKAILFGEYPWNARVQYPNTVTKASNWQEVLDYFNE
jgi:uncharacterized HAD superfamily protein